MDEKFFDGLGDQLAGAIQKSEEAKSDEANTDDKKDEKIDEPNPVDEVKKSVNSLSEAVTAIAKTLAPGREAKDDDAGEEPGMIVKAIKELAATAEANRDALEKALDRVEALEKGTVVRKSTGGDDGDDDTKLEKGKDVDKDLAQIGAAMKRIATHPGESATLT